MATINSSVHPEFADMEEDYKKYRLTYIGGRKYKEEYLRPREGEDDFASREAISYVPGYAKEAVLEVSRAIHQRLHRVSRTGGTGSYLEVAKGALGGIDRHGNTMNSFISQKVVDELCFMGKIGGFVDNVIPKGATKADLNSTDHPYVYAYKAEDIRDWAYFPDDPSRLRYVILQETIEVFDDTGLRSKTEKRFRHVYQDENGGVFVQFYAESGEPIGAKTSLALSRIPFVLSNLGMSLLQDVADHQTALLTLASMDMSYAVKSNVPFYTEQRNALTSDLMSQAYKRLPRDSNGNPINPEDMTEDTRRKFLRDSERITIGTTKGRYYSKDYDRPGFIHPSSEPLKASMEKQTAIATEIRELVALNVQRAGLRFQSEESKKMDSRPLEAGLSYIGLILQSFETQIAQIYAEYESAEPATIRYPESYNLLTEDERRQAISEDRKLISAVPSEAFRKAVQKQIIETKFGHLLDPDEVVLMKTEVEASQAPTSDAEELRTDVEAGIVSAEFASVARGYPVGEAAKAQEEKAVRLNIATRLQSSAHDNPDERPSDATKSEKYVLKET